MLRVSTAVMRQAHVGQITVAWTDCKTMNLSQSYIERIPVEKHSKSVFSFTEHPLPPLLYLSERSPEGIGFDLLLTPGPKDPK